MRKKGKSGIYFTGIDGLEKKLKKNASMIDVKNIVKERTGDLQAEAKRLAEFKGHYENGKFIKPTTYTKKSIILDFLNMGMTGKVSPKSEYSFYLEYGTRFMAAQPFIGPAYRKIKKQFLNDMEKLVK